MCFVHRSSIEALQGSVLIGSLKERCIALLRLKANQVIGEQRLLSGLNARIRDLRESAEGDILMITDEPQGALLRLSR